MKILNFGSCNVDNVYSVDHIVNAGETIATYKLELFPGGKGLNQSIAVARAGAEVYHAGCIGTDGDMLADILSESGVNLTYLRKENIKNGHAIIQVDKTGENSIFLYKGSNHMITREFVDEVLDNFSSEDFLLLQNEINNVPYIIDAAYKKGIKIVLNPSPFNEEIQQIDLSKITYLILNQVEAKGFSGKEKAEEFFSYVEENYPELKVILTLGKRGSIFCDKDNYFEHPSFMVETVDTTGAGDTFAGYFVSSVAEGKSYQDAIKIASAASALAVSKMGAATSIPYKNEAIEALSYLKPYNYKKKDKMEKKREIIFKYIEENLENACLEHLSKELGYSESYAGTLVKRLTNESFSQLLQKKRCKTAAELLSETDFSIGEIINKIGYENESFFRKMFKETYGKSPLEYRKLYRKN